MATALTVAQGRAQAASIAAPPTVSGSGCELVGAFCARSSNYSLARAIDAVSNNRSLTNSVRVGLIGSLAPHAV